MSDQGWVPLRELGAELGATQSELATVAYVEVDAGDFDDDTGCVTERGAQVLRQHYAGGTDPGE